MPLLDRLLACIESTTVTLENENTVSSGLRALHEGIAALTQSPAVYQAPVLTLAAQLCHHSDPEQRFRAYSALRPLLEALPASSLASALPHLLPHLLVSRYYGAIEVQRWPSQDTWRYLVTRLDAAQPASPTRSSAAAPSSPLALAVHGGLTLAASAASQPRLSPPPTSAPRLSPSAAAALAPGAEGVSISGPALVAQHMAPLAAHLAERLAALASAMQALLPAQPQPASASLPLLAAAMEAEALCHTVAELASGKVSGLAVAPHAPALLLACAPLQHMAAGVQPGTLAAAPLVPPTAAAAGGGGAAAAVGTPRPPPWVPRASTPFSTLAAVRLAAIVAVGKLLANFEACRQQAESQAEVQAQAHPLLLPTLAAWVGSLGCAEDGAPASPFASLRQQRSHCAMCAGLLLVCGAAAAAAAAGLQQQEGGSGGGWGLHQLVGPLCSITAQRLSGRAVSGEEVGRALAAGSSASSAGSSGAAGAGEVEGALYLMRELCAAYPVEAAAALLPPASALASRLAAEGASSGQQQQEQLVLLEVLWRAMVDVVKALGRAHVQGLLNWLLPPLLASAALRRQGEGGGAGLGHLRFAAAVAASDCAQGLAELAGAQVFAARVSVEGGGDMPWSGAAAAALLKRGV